MDIQNDYTKIYSMLLKYNASKGTIDFLEKLQLKHNFYRKPYAKAISIKCDDTETFFMKKIIEKFAKEHYTFVNNEHIIATNTLATLIDKAKHHMLKHNNTPVISRVGMCSTDGLLPYYVEYENGDIVAFMTEAQKKKLMQTVNKAGNNRCTTVLDAFISDGVKSTKVVTGEDISYTVTENNITLGLYNKIA